MQKHVSSDHHRLPPSIGNSHVAGWSNLYESRAHAQPQRHRTAGARETHGRGVKTVYDSRLEQHHCSFDHRLHENAARNAFQYDGDLWDHVDGKARPVSVNDRLGVADHVGHRSEDERFDSQARRKALAGVSQRAKNVAAALGYGNDFGNRGFAVRGVVEGVKAIGVMEYWIFWVMEKTTPHHSSNPIIH